MEALAVQLSCSASVRTRSLGGSLLLLTFWRDTLLGMCLTGCPAVGEQKVWMVVDQQERRDEARPIPCDCIEFVRKQEREAQFVSASSGFSWRCESWAEEGKREAITVPRIDQTEQSKREGEGQVESSVGSRDRTASRPNRKN